MRRPLAGRLRWGCADARRAPAPFPRALEDRAEGLVDPGLTGVQAERAGDRPGRLSVRIDRLRPGAGLFRCRHPATAITPDGAIRYDECIQCMDCVVIYHDEDKCAPLLLEKKHRAVIPVRVAVDQNLRALFATDSNLNRLSQHDMSPGQGAEGPAVPHERAGSNRHGLVSSSYETGT